MYGKSGRRLQPSRKGMVCAHALGGRIGVCKQRTAHRSAEEGPCLGPQEDDQLVLVWAWLLIPEFPKAGEPPTPGLTRAWSSSRCATLNRINCVQGQGDRPPEGISLQTLL